MCGREQIVEGKSHNNTDSAKSYTKCAAELRQGNNDWNSLYTNKCLKLDGGRLKDRKK